MLEIKHPKYATQTPLDEKMLIKPKNFESEMKLPYILAQTDPVAQRHIDFLNDQVSVTRTIYEMANLELYQSVDKICSNIKIRQNLLQK